MSRCFTKFPFSELGEPNIYHNLVCFTICGDFTWRVSDCEELVSVLEISIVHVVVSRQFFTGKDMKICFGIEIN